MEESHTLEFLTAVFCYGWVYKLSANFELIVHDQMTSLLVSAEKTKTYILAVDNELPTPRPKFNVEVLLVRRVLHKIVFFSAGRLRSKHFPVSTLSFGAWGITLDMFTGRLFFFRGHRNQVSIWCEKC